MQDTRIYDRAPIKDVRVKDPQIGTRTPQLLMSRKDGEYLRGDVLDANATIELTKSIHIPDIDKINKELEHKVSKDQIGQPNGVASLDANGNVPVGQLGNVDVDIFVITDSLPTEDVKDNKIYCIKDANSEDDQNVYVEYAHINGAWEKVGEFKADPDLSQYLRTDTNNFSIGDYISFIGTNISMSPCFKIGDDGSFVMISGGRYGTGIRSNVNNANKVFASNGSYFDTTTLLSKSDYQSDKDNLTEAIANANNATDKTNEAINNANTAASNVNTAIEQAMKVNAELSGNVLTVTNNQGVQKSVNLTDSDEHVTVNMISKVDGVTLEGVVVNVYINNGSNPLTYTTPENGQIEFTVTKGATYKVVFPDVHDCASVNPVQYTAAVGNRIIDAVYTKQAGLPEHVKVQLVKHDLNGNQEAYPNAVVVVTIGTEDPVTYNTNDEGVVEFDVANGSTYSVECPKVNDYYIQSNKYVRSYVAIQSSRIIKSNYYLYKTGLYIITDTGNEYSLEEWQEGNYDVSSAKLIKLSNEPLSMANNIIYLRISDITNRTYQAKQWCTENVQFTSITLNGNSTSDWAYYKGKESSDLILQEAEEKGRDVPAFTYAKSQSIEIGGKTVYGYIGSVGQWITLWANRDGIDDILNELYGSDTQLFSGFTSNKWTSTQSSAGNAWYFAASPSHYGGKTLSCLPVPFFAY